MGSTKKRYLLKINIKPLIFKTNEDKSGETNKFRQASLVKAVKEILFLKISRAYIKEGLHWDGNEEMKVV